MKKLYNEKEITMENVLELLQEVDTTEGPDDMMEEEKEIIRKVASQDYEGCEEDLEYLTNRLEEEKNSANLQDVYDVLSQGDWFYND
ncbi:hypothetical protein [Diplocloster modestus]|uniref:Uncharacterized protein n=1 Tax=Diplocloster modestus TaxID=2850322 RepID=A0ABS6KD75_9FIRM|nr:hypothetical protein [Diplocloster modestus]MBU9728477.1 hypothetical protein [Diplocloster modestus]